MKKFGVLAALAFVALLLGMAGTAVRSDDAQARPTAVISINPDVCIFYTIADWDIDSDGDTDVDEDDAIWACWPLPAPGAGLWNPDNLEDLADVLGGDVDDPDTYADLAAAGANQLIEDWGAVWVLAFVTNDDNVLFNADHGVLAMAGDSSLDCDADLGDEDCDEDGDMDDGVVVDLLTDATDRDEYELVVSQDGVDEVLNYTVVGEPEEIDVTALETTIMAGMDAADCADLSLPDFTDEVEAPQVGGLLATVTDDDGTPLAGVWVDWESDDTDVANVSLDSTLTVAVDDSIVAANFACGADEPGTAAITGYIDEDDDSVDITVVGEPADLTLTASPASITCDGTSSSTVSAALVDADGNPVPAGVEVRFDVVALGTADPITTATDAEGVATSKITPLSGVSAGVVVIVTVPDFDLEASIRVDCAAPAPTVAPPPPTVAPPPIVPPPTGDAGLLD